MLNNQNPDAVLAKNILESVNQYTKVGRSFLDEISSRYVHLFSQGQDQNQHQQHSL